ncbi:MAG: electron transport complex subunit RsxC [Provencibacterium sp.]|jgi:electron transport complex protein RnfC|nr:electron transport complex subunit RsxC [Provencibacterium sp.]
MAFLKRNSLSGVHVPHRKENTEDLPAVRMPVPSKVYISMQQHIGAPCKPLVKKGDAVKVGQLIGTSEAFVSVPVHSSVSGTVVDMIEIINVNSVRAVCVVIETDGLQTVDESVRPPEVHDTAGFIAAIRDSGLVGLGGAGFPTFIKLNPKNIDQVDTLVVNGAECEPYITSDYRTMMDHTDDVFEGIALLRKYLTLSHVYIGIEKNKPKAISLMRERAAQIGGIEIVELDAKYPKGAEKVIAYETTGRMVPEGKLPNDVGLIVSNVTSIAFMAQYMRTGMPLIEKTLTVDGSAVTHPQNVTVLIGTTCSDVFDFCGGYRTEPRLLLYGGPMMGSAILSDTYPIIKNNNALLAFAETGEEFMRESPCIRCGKCIQMCPYRLMPSQFEAAYKARDLESLNKLKVNLCMECGCCSYICPARRPLVQINRLAKSLLREQAKKA